MVYQAYKYSIMITFYLLLVAFFNTHEARGRTHIVGESNGWAAIINSYNWNQDKEFHVGDTIVFNYDTELHNVMQVGSTGFETCEIEPYIKIYSTGSDSVVLSEIGDFWFICGVSDHCDNGQKLHINVLP